MTFLLAFHSIVALSFYSRDTSIFIAAERSQGLRIKKTAAAKSHGCGRSHGVVGVSTNLILVAVVTFVVSIKVWARFGFRTDFRW